MSAFLVDTDVLIDVSKGNINAVNFLASLMGTIFISRISAMELIVGQEINEINLRLKTSLLTIQSES